MASTYSASRSPACVPTMVTPRMVSLPGAVSTFTKPCASLSAMARSRSSMPYFVTSTAMPCSLASCSFRPTRATSGSMKVAQGITR
ncbi:hypothetical protein D9M69_658810 [compost metagenome]